MVIFDIRLELLAMPYRGCVDRKDPVYQNTRKLVLSEDNPYFFRGKAAEGIGGPHIGYDMVWPMGIIMRAMTSDDDREIAWANTSFGELIPNVINKGKEKLLDS